MQTQPDFAVDVMVATCNRAQLITPIVESLRNSTGVDLRVWIMDQSDNDATAEVVQRLAQADPRINYVRIEVKGWSTAHNIGASLGQAPYLLFTDDDCRVDPGWAAALASSLADQQTWGAFGRILDETTEQSASDDVTPGLRLAVKMSTERAVYRDNRFNLGFGHGANMSLRRDAWQRLGGFDEALGPGAVLRSGADRDIGYRILAEGGQIVYTPDALVYHNQWRNWPAVWRAFRNYGIGTGATAGKYLRYGDLGGLVLLIEWVLNQGLRQVLSGLIKWRSWQKTAIGLQQFVMPLYGLVRSLRVPLSREHRVYKITKSRAYRLGYGKDEPSEAL
ncbi:glycosyltransferase family 2 protein [Candidatus Viridilinea mediisalina]|uniref:Glycosyl transferase n=1 Tax=Candidatus Viridilinea mediisalina TaxID=2024553 RepID=A0A2A6RJT7_9CHLR|nr:glycosyltransferase [Candidatus Viridilinea mediisalina]PDW03165.1 glycosyl transferase [Candidatus Viridilinea mediisalina]